MKLWLDTESRCELDVRVVGSYRYCEHDSFELLMCAWALDDGPVQVAVGALELYDQMEPFFCDPSWAGQLEFVAHNTTFDRVAISTHLGMERGQYLHPKWWRDSMVEAKMESYPPSLDKLTKALNVTQKDSAGTRLINLFCKPNRKGGWNDAKSHPNEWLEFIRYCGNDVEAMRDAATKLPAQSDAERAVWISDQLINDRGVRIDLMMAENAVHADADNKTRARAEVIELTGVENPGSVKQLTDWFVARGLEVTSLTKDVVNELLAGDTIDPDERRVLELRQELALASAPGKFKAAVAMACADDRIRGTANYYGAHTGRWSGRGIQLQNLPRHSLNELEPLALFDLEAGFGVSPDALKALVRPLLLGPLTVVDFKQIEARVLAWLSGEQWVLDAFAAGRDIYVETARRMGMEDPAGKGRQSGKSAVLGFGYGGGGRAAKNVGAKGTEEELNDLALLFRSANPNTKNFWFKLWEAFVSGGEYGRIKVHRSNGVRRIELPSGREIVYRGVQSRWVEKESQRTGKKYKAAEVSFRHPTGKRAYLWHGLITENVTQAVARDLMAECLPQLEQLGVPVISHVHDEIIAEGDYLEELSRIMTSPPAWAAGLPVEADGHVVERYTKNADTNCLRKHEHNEKGEH